MLALHCGGNCWPSHSFCSFLLEVVRPLGTGWATAAHVQPTFSCSFVDGCGHIIIWGPHGSGYASSDPRCSQFPLSGWKVEMNGTWKAMDWGWHWYWSGFIAFPNQQKLSRGQTRNSRKVLWAPGQLAGEQEQVTASLTCSLRRWEMAPICNEGRGVLRDWAGGVA